MGPLFSTEAPQSCHVDCSVGSTRLDYAWVSARAVLPAMDVGLRGWGKIKLSTATYMVVYAPGHTLPPGSRCLSPGSSAPMLAPDWGPRTSASVAVDTVVKKTL